MSRADFRPTPPVDVVIEADGDRWTLVFLCEMPQSLEKVWSAITEPEQLRQWSPFTPDRDLATTGEATLTMTDGDESVDLAATVTRAERPRLLEYTWDTDVLRWELEPTDSGTRLILRHTMKDLDQVPKVAAGWHICLDVAERLLAGSPVGPIVGQDAMHFGWQELHDAYARKLGITPTD